jgi:hypothetical protein
MKNTDSWNWMQSIAVGSCFGGLVAAFLYGPSSSYGWTGLLVFLMAAFFITWMSVDDLYSKLITEIRKLTDKSD